VDPAKELVNVYDDDARVVDVWPRRQAKASGRAVGAVNALILNGSGEVLLQLRHLDKENGGLWDKSVGGHVSAGEDFDAALVREASEELFSVPGSPRVRLASSDEELECLVPPIDLSHEIVLRRVALQRNLRDVRHAPGGGVRNVLYHLAIYLGRTELPVAELRPQVEEIGNLRRERSIGCCCAAPSRRT
jgi:8-oxo-dGTP pyrophosphatase MutT (NUDIX family)